MESKASISEIGINCIKRVFRAAVLLAAGIVAGYGLLTLVYLLPTKPMQANMASAADLFDKEREYYRVITGYISTQLDNYTDTWMVGNAVFADNDLPVWKQALACTRAEYGEGPLDGLIRYLSGEEGYTKVEYTRYWHGYLVLLKPLFLLFDYADLRVINLFMESALVLLVFGAFWQRGFVREGIAYFISLLFLMPVVVPLSIQFSIVFYIANGAMLVLLKWYQPIADSGHMGDYFQIVGMVTSFSDLLTYPIAALGMPLVCLTLCKGREQSQRSLLRIEESGRSLQTVEESKRGLRPVEESAHRMRTIWERIKEIVAASVYWGFGYGAMWAGKWVLSSIVLGDHTIANALSQIAMRSSHKQAGETIGVFTIWRRNIEFYFEKPYLLLITVCIVIACWVLFRNRNRLGTLFLDAIPFLLIACMPLVWYALAGQHSYEHHWFTFRGLMVSVFACLCCLGRKEQGA